MNINEFTALIKALFRNEKGRPYQVDNYMITEIFNIFNKQGVSNFLNDNDIKNSFKSKLYLVFTLLIDRTFLQKGIFQNCNKCTNFVHIGTLQLFILSFCNSGPYIIFKTNVINKNVAFMIF